MNRQIFTISFLLIFLIAGAGYAGNLTNVTATPQNSTVNSFTSYHIKFTTENSIFLNGNIRLIFPSSFDISQVVLATSENSATMDGELEIDSLRAVNSADPDTVVLGRLNAGSNVKAGANVEILVSVIGNPSTSGGYTIDIETLNAIYNLVDSGTSASFNIEPVTPIQTFSLTATPSTSEAGVGFDLIVSNALDANTNPGSGIVLISFQDGQSHIAPDGGTLPVLNPVVVSSGTGVAHQVLYKAESNVVLLGVVSDNSSAQKTVTVNVNPSTLQSFEMTGLPETTTAGADFPNPVKVTARDPWLNKKTDFDKTVYFSSTDPSNARDLFTFHSGNPVGLVNGERTFQGSDFQLRKTPWQTITVHGGSKQNTSDPIFVAPAGIASFNLTIGQNQIAGLPFDVEITNAKDVFDNPAPGTVTVSLLGSDHAAPNGLQPVLNDVSVDNNGAGKAKQVMFKAEPVIFRAQSGNYSLTSPTITVVPGALNKLGMSGLPSNVKPGEPFVNSVTVEAFDGYLNRKSNYGGTVEFASSDVSATLPAAYTFSGTEDSHSFPGSQFSLSTPGAQTLWVFDQASPTIADTSTIQVNSIRIVRITSTATTISQGQQNIPVSMEIENQGDQTVTNIQADLNFTSGVPLSDYTTSTATLSALAAGQSATLQFTVNADANSTVGVVTVDGTLQASVNGLTLNDNEADQKHQWTVVNDADLTVETITVSRDTLAQGQQNIELSTLVANNLGLTNTATADIVASSFVFKKGTQDISRYFSVTENIINPSSIAGGFQQTFLYDFDVAPNAPTGETIVSNKITYRDRISGIEKQVTSASLDTFILIPQAKLTVTEVTPSQVSATRGQEQDWTVRVGLRNDGITLLNISFDPNKTYILFKAGAVDYTPQFDIVQPTQFNEGGTAISPGDTLTMDFVINRTGNQLGPIPIIAWVESETGDKTNSNADGITSGITIQSPENLIINGILPSQPTVTQDDTVRKWDVKVALTNSGGSEVAIDFANTDLVLSDTTGFRFSKPDTLLSGATTLPGGSTDTLVYSFTKSGSNLGPVSLSFQTVYRVVNTNEVKNRQLNDAATVTVQSPSSFRITRVRASRPTVTAGVSPNWRVAVDLINSGGSDVTVDMDSTRLYFFRGDTLQDDFAVQQPTALAGSGDLTLKKGTIDSLIFPVLAIDDTLGSIFIRARAKAIENNRGLAFSDSTWDDRQDTVTIQQRGTVAYVPGSLDPQTVSPSANVEFRLQVQNNGQSTIELDPAQTRFRFSDGNVTFQALLDPGYATSLPGSGQKTTLVFRRTFVPSLMTRGTFTPQIFFVGTENGNDFTYTTSAGDNVDQVTVGSLGEISITSLTPGQKTVTLGQSRDWTIKVGIANQGLNPVGLDSAKLFFYDDTTPVSGFFTIASSPDTLLHSGRFLAAGKTDSVAITVDSVAVNAPLGKILLGARVFMTDSVETTRQFTATANNLNDITVQSPAVLVLNRLTASQPSVTRGQVEPWTIALHVTNSGQSALQLDPSPAKTLLSFDRPDSIFSIINPVGFSGSGSDILAGGASDSLIFNINKVNSASTGLGSVVFHSVITTTEINTGRVLSDNTQLTTGPAQVVVQDSARIRIDSLYVDVPSDSFVNGNQTFFVRANVAHLGGPNSDSVDRVRLELRAGTSAFPAGRFLTIDSIGPGENKTSVPGIAVRAPNLPNIRDIITARIFSSQTANTGNNAIHVASQDREDSTAVINVQTPGNLVFEEIVLERDVIPSATPNPWEIRMAVRNNGQASILLGLPQVSINAEGYVIKPADDPWGNDSLLVGGEADTITYVVTNTPSKSGELFITAQVFGTDQNDTTNTFALTRQRKITVETSSVAAITRTYLEPAENRVTEDGVGHVNTQQLFNLYVEVKNEGGQNLDRIWVSIDTDTSTIVEKTKTITNLKVGEKRAIPFAVRAASEENLTGELLTAAIDSAKGIDGAPARIDPGADTTAVIKIYQPARLQIVSTVNNSPNNNRISFNQKFGIVVAVANRGSEPAKDVSLGLRASTDTLAMLSQTPLNVEGEIAAGDTQSVTFELEAFAKTGFAGYSSFISSATGVNTNLPVADIVDPGVKDSTFATFEAGAGLVIEAIRLSRSEINAGARQNWLVEVDVRNTGSAELELINISSDNLKFSVGGKEDPDYKINPPAELLGSGNFRIAGKAKDTLVYSITKNGDLAGEATLTVAVEGFDRNVGTKAVLSNQSSVALFVVSDALAQIVQTTISTGNLDNEGNGMVNRGQSFQVLVRIRSGELVGVDSVTVVLSSNGNSAIKTDTLVIAHMDEDDRATAAFSVNAWAGWDPNLGEVREQFSARIIRAVSPRSSLPAEIRPPEDARDSLVVVRIQNPATLSLSLFPEVAADTINTKSQVFRVFARVENIGTAWVDSGEVQLELPSGYTFISGESFKKRFAIKNDSAGASISFTIMAPNIALPKANIRAFYSRLPVDLNTGANAKLSSAQAFLGVQTVISQLRILGFAIDSPEGAKDRVISTEQSFRIQARISASKDLRDRKATLILPTGLGLGIKYESVDPLEQPIVDDPDELFWTLNAPAKSVPSLHLFNLLVQAKTVDGLPVSVDTTLTVGRVDKKSTLVLDPLTVTSPASVMQGGEAYLSTGQEFVLQTRVQNFGAAETVGEGTIKLDLRGETNFTFITGFEEMKFTVGKDITWRMRAPEQTIETLDILARVLPAPTPRPADANTGLDAEFTIDSQTLRLHILQRGRVTINDLRISDPPGARDNTLSEGQSFTVTANISSEKTTNLVARILFSSESFKPAVIDISGLPDENINKTISWQVTAPSDASPVPDSIWIEVLYRDRSSQENLKTVSKKIGVWTFPKTTFSLSPELHYPPPHGINLRQQVSTGQAFTLMTRIRHTGAPFILSDSFVVKLARMPEGFDIAPTESLEKSVGGEEMLNGEFPTWLFSAPLEKPTQPGEFVFEFMEAPRDSNAWTQGHIPNKEVDIEIITVDRARVALLPSLGVDSGIDSGSVRIGTTFPVSVKLTDLGEAGVEGNFKVRLDLPQSGLFTTGDSLTKTGKDILVWTLRSPISVLIAPDTIKFTLITPPKDRNTKAAALVQQASSRILVTTEAGILIAKPFSVQSKSAILKGGTNIPILGMVFRNKDIANATTSILQSVRLDFRDRKREPLSPASIITRLAAVKNSGGTDILGEVNAFDTNSSVLLNFTKHDTIVGSRPDTIRFLVDIAPGAENINFQVSIDSASAFTAIDISGNPILIADSTAVPRSFLGFQSRYNVLVENDLKKAFYTYPNPFGRADRPETKFLYVLKQPSDVTIRLYTLTGDLVRTWEFNKAEHPLQTSEGLHQGEVTWDGLNGVGRRVMNGVYIAYITTEYGETAVTKIAYVK